MKITAKLSIRSLGLSLPNNIHAFWRRVGGGRFSHDICTVCSIDFVISHGGMDDIEKPVQTDSSTTKSPKISRT